MMIEHKFEKTISYFAKCEIGLALSLVLSILIDCNLSIDNNECIKEKLKYKIKSISGQSSNKIIAIATTLTYQAYFHISKGDFFHSAKALIEILILFNISSPLELIKGSNTTPEEIQDYIKQHLKQIKEITTK